MNSGRSEGRTWDKEIGGGINEKLDVGVRTSPKWNMENHIMCIVGPGHQPLIGVLSELHACQVKVDSEAQ